MSAIELRFEATSATREYDVVNEKPLDRQRILVVEDDHDLRDLVGEILENAGAVVSTADSEPAAFEAMQRETFDLLISDIDMPIGNGLSLIRRVRQMPATAGGKIPAMAFTAHSDDDMRHKAFQAGFQSFLAKPFGVSALVARVVALKAS